ncbi:MAG: hypothetical protein ACT4OI_01705 [Methanobacteriota archaeon]
MGLRLLRWLLRLFLWFLWPARRRRRREEPDEDDGPRPGRGRGHRRSARRTANSNTFRIEVDNEIGRFHDGPAFSFWSSSRIILILSLLLWWIQPAGPMIAGYVGGRRAGSPWKAVVAALAPVVVILVANYAYTHNFAASQIDFVASLPLVVGDGAASILPFLAPYRDFLIAYLQGFVEALRATFGMGTNGYLMVILFAYIGGLIGEQTRRELASRGGAPRSHSFGLTLPWPFVHARHEDADAEGAEVEDEEEAVPHRQRRPAYARGRPVPVGARGHRSRRRASTRFEDMRKVDAESLAERAVRRAARARRRDEDDEDDEDDDADEEPEDEPPVRRRHPVRAHGEHRREPPRREPDVSGRDPRPAKPRSREEELAIQRFVERALRNYDKTRI